MFDSITSDWYFILNKKCSQSGFSYCIFSFSLINQSTCLCFLCQFFAIFAFSTCGSYSGVFRMSVECENRTESDLDIDVEFDYPFRSELCTINSFIPQ